jgi:hypothetical protein
MFSARGLRLADCDILSDVMLAAGRGSTPLFPELTWSSSQPKDEGVNSGRLSQGERGSREEPDKSVYWFRVDPAAFHSFKLRLIEGVFASSRRRASPIEDEGRFTATIPRKHDRDVPFPESHSFQLPRPRQDQRLYPCQITA